MQAFNWIKARVIFYPTLLWNVVLGRWLKVRNWRDPIDDHVVLGAFPFSKDVSELAGGGKYLRGIRGATDGIRQVRH